MAGGRRGRRGLENLGKERPQVQHSDLHALVLERPPLLPPPGGQRHQTQGCRAPSTTTCSDLDQAALGRSRVLGSGYTVPLRLLSPRQAPVCLAPQGSDRSSSVDPQIAEVVNERWRPRHKSQVTLCKKQSFLSHSVLRPLRDQGHGDKED